MKTYYENKQEYHEMWSGKVMVNGRVSGVLYERGTDSKRSAGSSTWEPPCPWTAAPQDDMCTNSKGVCGGSSGWNARFVEKKVLIKRLSVDDSRSAITCVEGK